MRFRQILAAVLVLMLIISPAFAAYCSASCAQVHLSDESHDAHTMEGMDDCHGGHASPQGKAPTDAHGNCNMPGCHTAASALIFDPSTPTPSFDAENLRPQFVAKAISADLPPPIKPPA